MITCYKLNTYNKAPFIAIAMDIHTYVGSNYRNGKYCIAVGCSNINSDGVSFREIQWLNG